MPAFPLAALGGKLDKDVAERPWILGLKADIAAHGNLKNPVIVWNHHPLRGKKQPYWLLRAGSNRVWCAEQLGWKDVPAVVSVDPAETLPSWLVSRLGHKLEPLKVQAWFLDGGNIWANEHGFGLLRAKAPEVTYAGYAPTATELAAVVPTNHGQIKLTNPLVDEC